MAASRCGSAASRVISAARRAGRKIILAQPDGAARRSSTAALALLVLIERMRQRYQDGGPPDRRELGDSRGARARDHQMRRRDPRRQVRKERRDLGADAQPRIGVANLRQILAARLLGDQETDPQRLVEPFDRGRHDLAP